MNVALVHDWLTTMGGAERVLLALSEAFPDAPIFTSVYDAATLPLVSGKQVHTSFLQHVPFAKTHHQLFPTLRPLAFESFDLGAFDVVLSSASAEAKGVITKPETCHICYCHTPTRYYWSDYHAYRNRLQFGMLNHFVRARMPRLTEKMRIWDYVAAQRVDRFIANSQNTATRIRKYYHRDAAVIYPPVDTEHIQPTQHPAENYFLIVSRLVPYKNVDLVVDAMNELKLPLKIVGTGPELNRLKQRNTSSSTEFLETVSDREKIELYQNCRALIFPTEEDAGITPLEAMAAGRPVVAYGGGGALETVVEGVTGTFFREQKPHSLVAALRMFDPAEFDTRRIRDHAERFSKERFKREIRDYAKRAYAEHLESLRKPSA